MCIKRGKKMQLMEIIWPLLVSKSVFSSKPLCAGMITLLQLDVFTPTKAILWRAGPLPPLKLRQTPIPQSGSVLCPLVMDYCKEDGGGMSVSLSLMRQTQRGVPPATQTMMVNMWGIKKSRDILFFVGKPGTGGHAHPC